MGRGGGVRGREAAITALDHLGHFVGLLSPDGVLLEANATALTAGGLMRSDVVGRPVWETRWWSHSVQAQKELRRRIGRAAAGERVRYLADVLAGDGGRGVITVDLELSPVRGGDGSVRFVLAEAKAVEAAADPSETARVELIGDLMSARQATERLRRLATGLAEAATVAEVTAAIAERAADALEAQFANVAVLEPGAELMDLYHPVSLGEIASRWLQLPVDDSTVLGHALTTGEHVHVGDLGALATRFPAMRDDAEAAGLRSLAGHPLDLHGSPLRAAIGLAWSRARPATDHEELATVLALCGAALQRAWANDELTRAVAERREREDQQRRVARELQAGLLPSRIPHLDGWEIVVRYLPTAVGLDVGGDWYDLIDVDVDDYGVVVGDVVGHDVRAAVGMSQLRNALAGLSHARRDPAAVLERLDDYASHTPGLLGATVFYGRLQPMTGVVSYSTAGHPPPLVVRADGSTSFLSAGRAAPVGVRGPRPSAASTLEPGDLVLCYTDGLIERRDEPITVGMRRLARTVREQAPGASLDDLADRLLCELPPAGGVDDIALLGLRRMPSRRT